MGYEMHVLMLEKPFVTSSPALPFRFLKPEVEIFIVKCWFLMYIDSNEISNYMHVLLLIIKEVHHAQDKIK